MPSLNNVPRCVTSNQTASCVKRSVPQPFNRSWQTSQKRDLHTNLLTLPTPVLITSAPSTSPFVRLPRKGGYVTCLTTLAVPFEVVPPIDTSSCVMGVERFVSRWGTPAMIWSDNGTNFIGAEKEHALNNMYWNNTCFGTVRERACINTCCMY